MPVLWAVLMVFPFNDPLPLFLNVVLHVLVIFFWGGMRVEEGMARQVRHDEAGVVSAELIQPVLRTIFTSRGETSPGRSDRRRN